jgi:hypothetical protein
VLLFVQSDAESLLPQPGGFEGFLRFLINRRCLHLVWRSLATGPPVARTRSSVSRANETSSELLKK